MAWFTQDPPCKDSANSGNPMTPNPAPAPTMSYAQPTAAPAPTLSRMNCAQRQFILAETLVQNETGGSNPT